MCGLTSITLLLIGTWGRLKKASLNLDQSRSGTLRNSDKIRRIVGRLLTIGLPFLATFKLGAARFTLVLLLGLASNLVAIEDEATDLNTFKGWKRLLTYRRYTLASIVLQMVYDLTTQNDRSDITNIGLGYLALGLSMFCFPLPFPSPKSATSTTTSSAPSSESTTSTAIPSRWNVLSKPENPSVIIMKTSPLISSYEETTLTVLGGGILGSITIFFRLLSASNNDFLYPLHQLLWAILISCLAASALVLAQPRTLRSNKGLGLVVGSLLSTFFLVSTEIDSLTLFAFQSVLISISFAALKFDSRISLSTSSTSINHQHQHQHQAGSHMEHGQMSRFSEFILRTAPKSQLLHSILVEKDSRRIFYFMWLVLPYPLMNAQR